MSKSTKRKHPLKKDSNQIDRNENNINKQLTEIRLNKHKNYLQSKNLEREIEIIQTKKSVKMYISPQKELFKRRAVVE